MNAFRLAMNACASAALLAGVVTVATPAEVTLTPRSIVNQSGVTLESGGSRWLGTGANAAASRLGILFAVPPLPGTALRSATLQLRPSWTQWIAVDAQIAAELSPNPLEFGARALPSERVVTSDYARYTENTRWGAAGVYGIDVTAPVRALLAQYAAPVGLALIATGHGTAWGRKFFAANGAIPNLKLVFDDPPAPPPAPASAASGPTFVGVGASASDAGSGAATHNY